MCVLYLLKNHDRYGYELTQKINKHISITEGALYPVLRRLVKEDFCETYLVESTSGPARKYYRITADGKEYLHLIEEEWNLFVKDVAKLREEEDNE